MNIHLSKHMCTHINMFLYIHPTHAAGSKESRGREEGREGRKEGGREAGKWRDWWSDVWSSEEAFEETERGTTLCFVESMDTVF